MFIWGVLKWMDIPFGAVTTRHFLLPVHFYWEFFSFRMYIRECGLVEIGTCHSNWHSILTRGKHDIIFDIVDKTSHFLFAKQTMPGLYESVAIVDFIIFLPGQHLSHTLTILIY